MKLTIAFLLLYSGAFGQNFNSDLSQFTKSAVTIPKYSIQIESNVSFEKSPVFVKNFPYNYIPGSTVFYYTDIYIWESQFRIPSLSLRFALTDRLELQAAVEPTITKLDFMQSGSNSEPVSYASNKLAIGSYQAGIKFQFIKNKDRKTKFAGLVQFNSVQRRINLYRENWVSTSLVASHSFYNRHKIAYSLGGTIDLDSYMSLSGSLLYAFQIVPKLSVFTELGYNTIYTPDILVLNSGIKYMIGKSMQLDFNFAHSLKYEKNGYYKYFPGHKIGIGFSVLLNNKSK